MDSAEKITYEDYLQFLPQHLLVFHKEERFIQLKELIEVNGLTKSIEQQALDKNNQTTSHSLR